MPRFITTWDSLFLRVVRVFAFCCLIVAATIAMFAAHSLTVGGGDHEPSIVVFLIVYGGGTFALWRISGAALSRRRRNGQR